MICRLEFERFASTVVEDPMVGDRVQGTAVVEAMVDMV